MKKKSSVEIRKNINTSSIEKITWKQWINLKNQKKYVNEKKYKERIFKKLTRHHSSSCVVVIWLADRVKGKFQLKQMMKRIVFWVLVAEFLLC